MIIKVTNLNTDEIIYESIEAEDFLYEMNGDSELEENIALLENSDVGDCVVFFGDEIDYEMEKLEDENIFSED
jgi:hypothetical protein